MDDPESSLHKTCYRCGRENPIDQSFCGNCGSPLALNDYISKSVSENLAGAIRDRDVLETESSIRVFERAWGWVKIVGTIAAALLAIVGAGVLWKVSDWWHAVDSAKIAVTTTANNAQQQIQRTSQNSVILIQSAATGAQLASSQAAAEATKQSQSISRTAASTRKDLASESSGIMAQIATTQSQLEAAQALRPGMEATQRQLTTALAQVKEQQKVISSSQNFVKEIFSSYTTDIVWVGKEPKTKYAVVPPEDGSLSLNGKKITAVYIVLSSVPIAGTVQLQWGVYSQPRNSYVIFHNLLIAFWGDPPGELVNNAFDVSYFPDKGDTDTIKSLVFKDGRVFADGEPLPKFGHPDPDFRGNKWIRGLTAPTTPTTPTTK